LSRALQHFRIHNGKATLSIIKNIFKTYPALNHLAKTPVKTAEVAQQNRFLAHRWSKGSSVLKGLRALLKVTSHSAQAFADLANVGSKMQYLYELAPTLRVRIVNVEDKCGTDIADALLFGFPKVDPSEISDSVCKSVVENYLEIKTGFSKAGLENSTEVPQLKSTNSAVAI